MAEANLYLYSPGTTKSTALKMTKQVSLTGIVKDGDTSTTKTYALTLEKLEYQKKMYSPCWIKATIKAGPSTSGGALPTHKDMEAFFSKMKVELDMDNEVVATNYFVFKVRTIRTRVVSSTVTVILEIYSEDKLLTLEKYSKAYTAKRLGKEIFTEEVKQFSWSTTPVATPQILSYSDGAKEFIQPYLVQYNESFYDFLRRTANRCGEFLYFEGGALNLGLVANHLDQDETKSDGTVVYATDYGTIAMKCFYDSLYDEGGFKDGDTAGDYAYNYMGKDSDDKPLAHFASSGYQYNDPLATDDYLDAIPKDYTSYEDELNSGEQIAMAQILMALSGTSISEIISNFAVESSFNLIEAAYSYRNKNDDSKEVNITPWKNGDNPKDADQWDSSQDNLCQFGVYGDGTSQISTDSLNLNALFYSLVRKAEKKVGEDSVTLEFGSNFQNLKLGDVIKVENVSYLVIEVSGCHEYVESSYTTAEQHVVAIPLYTVPNSNPEVYLAIPQALTDVPIRKSEPQLAFVSDVLDPKKIGRIRIRFPWQKESDDASPWIRVSLPFATNGGGVKFKPEKDDEVLVGFEEGNVERPYVSGYLLSERSNDAWGSLDDRAIVSRNGHGIIFDDKPGSDFFYSNIYPGAAMLKSFFPTSVWPDTLDDVASCNALAGGIKLRDKYGLYEISASSDSRAVKIESAFGDVSINAFTGISISAPNGDISISGKNVEITASNNLKLTSGKGIKDRFVQGLEVSTGNKLGDFALSAGINGLNIIADTLGAFATKIVSDFLDLSLIRTVIEIVIRPIDGTTTIKSHTFVQIEAGKGAVEFPTDQVNHQKVTSTTFVDINGCLDAIPSTVNARIDAINTATSALAAAIQQFNGLSGKSNGLVNKAEGVITFATVKSKGWKKTADTLKDTDTEFKWDAVGLKDKELIKEEDVKDKIMTDSGLDDKPDKNGADYKPDSAGKTKRNFQEDSTKWENACTKFVKDPNKTITQENADKKNKRQTLVDCANSLAKAFEGVYKAFDDTDNLANLSIPQGVSISQAYANKCLTSIKKYKDFVSANDSKLFDKLANGDIASNTDLSKPLGNDVKKRITRKVVHDFMGGVVSDVNGEFKDSIAMATALTPPVGDILDDSAWKTAVDLWFPPVQAVAAPTPSAIKENLKSLGMDKLSAVKDWWVDNYWDPWKTTLYNRHRWKTGVQGKILLSDTPETTISFEKDGTAYKQVNAIASSKTIFDIRNHIKTL